MTLQTIHSESGELAANPVIRAIIEEIEKHFLYTIEHLNGLDQPLRFNISIQHGKAQTFGIHNVALERFPRVAIRFATLMRRDEYSQVGEAHHAEDTCIRLSRNLLKTDRIGLLDPACLQDEPTISF